MAKFEKYEDFENFINDIVFLYIKTNYKIKNNWDEVNEAFLNILKSEKKLRRYLSLKKDLNDNVLKYIDEFESVYNDSLPAFSNFSNDKLFENRNELFDNLKRFGKTCIENIDYLKKFLDNKMTIAKKSRKDFFYCIEWFYEEYAEILNNSYEELLIKWSSKGQEISYSSEFIQLFKYLFSCLEQNIIENVSYKNVEVFDNYKKKYKILENETLYDFLINYFDRNTTIFQIYTLIEENNTLKIFSKDFIYKTYGRFFPSIKLITEVRNILEHRTNSLNIDLTVLNQEFIFFLSSNLFFINLIGILWFSNSIDFEKIELHLNSVVD